MLMEDGGSVSGEGLIFLSLISLFNITHRQGACDNRAYPRGGLIERLRYPGFGVRVRVVSSYIGIIKVQTSTKILPTKIMLPVHVHRNRGILTSLIIELLRYSVSIKLYLFNLSDENYHSSDVNTLS